MQLMRNELVLATGCATRVCEQNPLLVAREACAPAYERFCSEQARRQRMPQFMSEARAAFSSSWQASGRARDAASASLRSNDTVMRDQALRAQAVEVSIAHEVEQQHEADAACLLSHIW